MHKQLQKRLSQVLLSANLCLLFMLSSSKPSEAQVNSYAFSQSSGTFSTIKSTGTLVEAASYATSGNTLDTKGWNIALPFSFSFNGIPYTSVYANSNGGVTFGTATSNASSLISDATAYAGAIAAMNRDLWGIYGTSGTVTNNSNVITNVASFYGLSIGATLGSGNGIPSGATVTAFDPAAGTITMSANATSTTTTASIKWGTGKLYTFTTGTAPNRKFTIEWSDFADYNTSASNNQTRFSFQIVLNETTNIIDIIYGDYTTLSTNNRANQVGLRGAANTDYNNRTGTGAWSATTAGTSNSGTVSRNNTTFPASGQTFTWTPPACFAPAGIQVSAVTAATATVSWNAPAAAPANGYEYYYSTSNTAPGAATTPSGTTATGVTTADLSGLAANTTYYVWVRSICSATDKSTWAASSFYTGHCIPSGGTTYYLSGITTTGAVANINYTASTGQGYVNNTASNIGTYAGNMIGYTLTPSSGTNYFYIWVDWNNDLDFGDAGETILATTTYTSNATGSFTVPAAQPTGNYRIRFANSFSGTITACGPSSNGNYVDYTLQVGATPSCLPPGTPTVSNISSGGATISWTAASPAPANGYEYYYSTSNTAPGATTTPSGSVAAGVTTANLSGLMSNTTYYAWVRSVCNATDKSTWSIIPSFTTSCGVYTAPFIEAFEGTTFVPACWAQASGLLASPTVFGTTNNYWNRQHFGDASATITNGSARINIYTTNRKDWLITPSIDLGTTPKQLEFDIALTAYYSGTASTLGVDDTFAVVISTDNGTTWTEANVLQSWNSTTPIANGTGNHIIIDLTPYTGIVKIGFYAESTVSNADNDLFIDNVKVINIPSCQVPTALNVPSTSYNGATISWTASTSAPANGYEYYYSTSNTAPGTATIPSGSTAAGVTTANITGLASNTTYYAWVRANCSATDKSEWTNAVSFYTGYCIPVATSSATYINSVTTTGGISNISNASTGFTTGGYADYYNTNSMTIVAGDTATISFDLAGGTTGVSIYVDLDNNFTFSIAERLYTSSAYLATGLHSADITIPAGIIPGSYRARIITDFNSTTPIACGFNSGRGEAEDYKIIVPNCTIPVVALGNDTAICPGAVLPLNAGNSGATYSWSTGATSQTINVTAAGIYAVTVSNGVCTATDSITVTMHQAPVVNLGNDMAICQGSSLALNAGNAGAAYLWDNAATTQTRVVNAAGTYFVAVTDANMCTGRDTIMITENMLPAVNLGNDTLFCIGESHDLDATTASGISYLWDNGSTAAIRTINNPGTYFVAVTDANMCTGYDTVNVAAAAAPIVDLGNDTSICSNNTITLDAGNQSADYLWSTGAISQTIDVSTPGTYYVSVTVAGLCVSSDTIVVAIVAGPAISGINATYANAGTYYFNALDTQGVISYTWDFGDGSPTETGYMVQHTYTTNGIYTVTCTGQGECDGTMISISRTVDVFDATTGIDDLKNDRNWMVYPNPANNVLIIENKAQVKITEVAIYTITGKRAKTMSANSPTVKADVTGLASGMYMLRVKDADGTTLIKKIEISN